MSVIHCEWPERKPLYLFLADVGLSCVNYRYSDQLKKRVESQQTASVSNKSCKLQNAPIRGIFEELDERRRRVCVNVLARS